MKNKRSPMSIDELLPEDMDLVDLINQHPDEIPKPIDYHDPADQDGYDPWADEGLVIE